jgi:hypothetical protein
MNLPGYTAEASIYVANQQYSVTSGASGSAHDSVLPAQSAVRFIDPYCGPCECHAYDIGRIRGIFCARQCSKLESVDPLGMGIYYLYTRSCSLFGAP